MHPAPNGRAGLSGYRGSPARALYGAADTTFFTSLQYDAGA